MPASRLSPAGFDDVLQTRLLLEGEAAERGALRLFPADREAPREGVLNDAHEDLVRALESRATARSAHHAPRPM